MDIGRLYETLTGEPYPHAPERVVEAAWALSNRAEMLRSLPPASERTARPRRGKAQAPPSA